MKTAELKRIAQRRPFRPFGVRLSNGARYFFNEPRQFGAPKDFHVIFFLVERNGRSSTRKTSSRSCRDKSG